MVSSSDFDLQRVMASGFVAATESFNPSKALRWVLQSWGDVYDGETVSLPSMLEAPADLPTVTASSSDGAWRLELSRARVNLFWLRRNGALTDLSDTFVQFGQRIVTIFEKENAGLGRLGAVVTRVASMDAPGLALAQQFCRDEWLRGPLNRPEGFELHAHKTFDLLPGLPVNSWFRIKTAKGGSADYRYLTVEQDINTLAQESETRRFGQEETVQMFTAAARELDVILGLYFPASRR